MQTLVQLNSDTYKFCLQTKDTAACKVAVYSTGSRRCLWSAKARINLSIDLFSNGSSARPGGHLTGHDRSEFAAATEDEIL